MSHSVKLKYYCEQLGIKRSNLSQFLRGYDRSISIDKLEMLCDLIRSDLSEKIA